MSSSGSEEISENDMPGMRKAIPKEETFNKYGDAARRVGTEAIEQHATFRRIPLSGIPDGGL